MSEPVICPQNHLLERGPGDRPGFTGKEHSHHPLPIIGAELNAGAALTWVVTAYLLAATAALPIYGKLSDMF